MRPTLPIAALLLGCTLPATAQASDIGSQSSGSITVTVIIPPVAAALQAQSEGAVGIDSVVDTKSALMISLPSSLSAANAGEEGASKGAIFHGSDLPVSIAAEPNAGLILKTSESTQLNGMIREGFSLVRGPCAISSLGELNQSSTVLISAV